MTYRHLFVHLDNAQRSDVRAAFALNLARRFGAHLHAGFAECDPYLANLASKRVDLMYGEAAEEARHRLTSRAQEESVPITWSTTSVRRDSALAEAVIDGARHSDLAILGQHDPSIRDSGVPRDLVERVILQSGRPVLVIPFVTDATQIGARVMIVWSGGREATRALHDALPFLAGARDVILMHLSALANNPGKNEPPCAGIVRHLQAHGITAEVESLPVKDITAIDMLLSRVSDRGIDLLVMGAHGLYGHPHLPQGTTTRHVLKQMTVPVLMSY